MAVGGCSDLSRPSGRLRFQIIEAIADIVSGTIQERVKARLRNALAKGRRLGRPEARESLGLATIYPN
jgi:DNA invertase Pin-like site-specific DNA recombinase